MIRRAIKYFLVNSITLYLLSLAVSGIVFEKGITTIALAGFALAAASLVIRPIINVLLLPINLVTFGLFRWVSYAVTFYIITLIVPGFRIAEFAFKGFSPNWISLPSFTLSGTLAIIAFSFITSIICSIIDWLLK